MTEQAKRTAAVLGHNYPGSRWYEDSYDQLAENGVAPPTRATERANSFFARTLGSVF